MRTRRRDAPGNSKGGGMDQGDTAGDIHALSVGVCEDGAGGAELQTGGAHPAGGGRLYVARHCRYEVGLQSVGGGPFLPGPCRGWVRLLHAGLLRRGSPRLSPAPLGPYAAVVALQGHLALVAHGPGRRARRRRLGRELGLQRTVGADVRRHRGIL